MRASLIAVVCGVAACSGSGPPPAGSDGGADRPVGLDAPNPGSDGPWSDGPADGLVQSDAGLPTDAADWDGGGCRPVGAQCQVPSECCSGMCPAGRCHNGIECRSATCDPTSEVCCAEDPVQCMTLAACEALLGVPVSCDGPEDCSDGKRCCLMPDALHVARCDDGAQGCMAWLCHTDPDCNAGEACCWGGAINLWEFKSCRPAPCP